MLAYGAVRRLSGFLLSLFYRRIEVRGLERLPREGPVIVAANHQNALVDGMLLIAMLPRPLQAMAKAPLFRSPVVGPFLRLLDAIPVHRPQDPGADLSRNEEMFRAVIAELREGGAILIFPEGVSQPEPALMPLRTGAARMLLGTESSDAGPVGVRLVPVGLVFHEPGTFRAGWALVLVGEPVPTDDCVALHASAPEEAVRRLTARLGEAMAGLIVEAGDRQTMRLVEVAEAIWRAESPGVVRNPSVSARWQQRLLRGQRYLAERAPERVAALRQEVELFAQALELSRLTVRSAGTRPPLGAALRYALREAAGILLGLPVALLGIASHALPYNLTRWAIRLVSPSGDAEATYKLAGGAFIYLVCWTMETWVVWRIAGPWLALSFAAMLLPSGFFALSWAERLSRAGREARRVLRFLVDRDLPRLLLERRRAIMEELTALERLVPPAVLDGDPITRPPDEPRRREQA